MIYSFNFKSNSSYNFVHTVKGTSYKVHFVYDVYTDSYYMSIDKLVNNAFSRVVSSIRVTTGINLLLQYQYLEIGGIWVIPTNDVTRSEIPGASTITNGFTFIWEHEA